MNPKPSTTALAATLRRHAVRQLRGKRKHYPAQAAGRLPQRTLHELQMHQIELEMQNAELQEARDRMEAQFETLKQAEDLLRRNEALFSALIQQAPVGVYVVDDQLRLQEVNAKARPVFSKVQPLKGRRISEVLRILWPEKIAKALVARFRHTLQTGKPYHSPEFTERRRDLGVLQSYEWQLQRITLPAGHHGVACFFTDITDRKRAEATQRRLEVLAASNRKLEREIVRRHAVEKSLQSSERHQRKLLEESRLMQERLQHLARQVLLAQEEERKRISRELHDQIAQTLTGINVQLGGLKVGASIHARGLRQQIARTQRLVEHSVEIVHRFARDLRPSVLDDLGLIPALHSFVKIFTKQARLRVRLKLFAGVEQLDAAKRTVLYRVAQEALTNVARHARATRVDICLEKIADTARLRIKDDGQSFPVERTLRARNNKRLGLLGMRERVEMIAGRLRIESIPGRGTTIEAQIPFRNGKRKPSLSTKTA